MGAGFIDVHAVVVTNNVVSDIKIANRVTDFTLASRFPLNLRERFLAARNCGEPQNPHPS